MRTNRVDVVDFHSHVLPTADHGSSSLEISLSQLKRALAKGITRVIATPHFYPMNDDVESFLKRRATAYELLASALTPELPSIKVGAEVMVCDGIDHLPGIEKLFINGTQTILVELPLAEFQPEYAASVYRLTSQGIKVVLAHPERYDPEAVSAMLDSGVLLQCNASSLVKLGKFKKIWPWIAGRHIIAMGSDIHKTKYSVYNDFVKATVKLDNYIDFIKEQSDVVWNEAKFGLDEYL